MVCGCIWQVLAHIEASVPGQQTMPTTKAPTSLSSGEKPDRLLDADLQSRRAETQENLNEISYGYYKVWLLGERTLKCRLHDISPQWSIIGAIVSVPIPRWFKMKGATKFTPLLALVSAGTIVDYINAYDDGEALRMDLRALDAEVRTRKQRAQDALKRIEYLQQQAEMGQQSSVPSGPKKQLPDSAVPPPDR